MADTELLDAVIKAHGGLERWSKAEKLSVTLNIRGPLWALKGFPGHSRATFEISTTRSYATIQNLLNACAPEESLVFDDDSVSVVDSNGQQTLHRDGARAAFAGHTLTSKWDSLHLAYFAGYAIWNYLVTPFAFTWPGFATQELSPHVEPGSGETWRVLEVTYPDGFPMHCKTVKYYFDEKTFMLRRLDYRAEVNGAASATAHYCMDYKTFDGLVFPTLRRVLRISNEDGKVLFYDPGTFILLDICDVKVHNQE